MLRQLWRGLVSRKISPVHQRKDCRISINLESSGREAEDLFTVELRPAPTKQLGMLLIRRSSFCNVVVVQLLACTMLSALPVHLADTDAISVSPAPQLSVTEDTPTPIEEDRARFDKDLGAERKTQYSFIQKVLANFLQPKPLVDTIREEDKYGNDGEGFSGFGRGVVGGVTTLTNLLSSAIDIPFEALKNVTRKATASLNSLGTKLIGL